MAPCDTVVPCRLQQHPSAQEPVRLRLPFAPGRRILLPLCFGFASYAAYTAGLPGDKIMDLKWAAMFQMVGVALTAAELWRALNTDRQNAALAEVKA